MRALFSIFGSVGALFLVLSPASAESVEMYLAGVGNSTVMAGVYVNPYTGTVNGRTALLVCDDYFAHSYIAEKWTATVTRYYSDLSQTKWGATFGEAAAKTLYDEAAWLTTRLLSVYSANPTDSERLTQSYLSFAIWTLFSPAAVDSLAGPDKDVVNWYIQEAQTKYKPGSYGGFTILTPVCNSNCSDPPQEFLIADAPEPASGMLFALGIAALVTVHELRRRHSA